MRILEFAALDELNNTKGERERERGVKFEESWSVLFLKE